MPMITRPVPIEQNRKWHVIAQTTPSAPSIFFDTLAASHQPMITRPVPIEQNRKWHAIAQATPSAPSIFAGTWASRDRFMLQ